MSVAIELQDLIAELHAFVHGDESATVPLGRPRPGETATRPIVLTDALRRMVNKTKGVLGQLVAEAETAKTEAETAKTEAETAVSAAVEAGTGAAAAMTVHNNDYLAHPALQEILGNLAYLPAWDDETGRLTFNTASGAEVVINLSLEALAYNLDYNAESKELIFIRPDDTDIRVSVMDLVDVYVGSIGDQIQITTTGNVIRATLLAGAITEALLAVALQAKINGKAEAADLQAHAANAALHPVINWGTVDIAPGDPLPSGQIYLVLE